MRKNFINPFFIAVTGTVCLFSPLFSQSGPEYRRSAVMRGNLVKSVFGNWGVIGQPQEKGARGAWINDNNGYIGDVSPIVGAEIQMEGIEPFHSVIVCPVSRPTQLHELSPSGKYWGLEPVAGYLNETQEGVALYSDPESWPSYWPDKMDETDDPGWAGSWNGFFGKKTTASEECYFVMDDNADQEFNYADNNIWNVSFKPSETDPSRNGLGLRVKVRGMQWSNFLAQDCIFWLYEITNTSTTDYSKVFFGMLVGTYVGVTSTEDYHEYDDDYSFFDVEKDLTYTADFDDNCDRNPRWEGDVGVVGYAFLESPGNSYDGIDNDGDADSYPLVSSSGPFFSETDFQPRIINAGDKLVLIDKKYERTVVIAVSENAVYYTKGDTIEISPGITELVEGNIISTMTGEEVNSNAYDGIDNDLDGLIDENYYLHYHQIRKDSKGKILIDKFSPVRYKDYINTVGVSDMMTDEKRDDGIDNDGDWNPEFDDVGRDCLAGTNDTGEGDGFPTPGEPNFDDLDVDESDQIGLTSFEYFTPANSFSMADDEDLWRRLSPGYFEVPASIVNNKPERGEDGDFTYGSGYFPLPAGKTEWFSLALVYGEGGGPNVEIQDLLKNRETVQKIYNSDYQFPPAPDKPTLTVVPGNGQVTLYWDRKAEQSFDPVLKEYDFEGYKLFKATDQNFNEVFTITDAHGNPIFYEPLVQYDIDDDINGCFYSSEELYNSTGGASFYLGDDTGLQHSYVDTDVENGRRYFYALVAYDRGNREKDIFPQENNMRIDLLPTGEVRTFQNTAVVIPNAETAGYENPVEGKVQIHADHAVGTGNVYYEIIDEQALSGHSYRLEFWDTANDGMDNNNNAIHDLEDSTEYFVPVTTVYSVLDLTGITESFVARDTFFIRLEHAHIVEESVVVKDESGAIVPESKYILNADGGRIRGNTTGDLLYGETYKITFKYYPVYMNPYIENSPWEDETLDTEIFDGMELSFNNHWNIVLDTLRSGWKGPEKFYNYSFQRINTYFNDEQLLGLEHPSDYRIEFADGIIDTSYSMPEYFAFPIPVNFRIYNMTDQRYLDFIYVDPDGNKKLSPVDEVILLEKGLNENLIFTWDVFFTYPQLDSVFDFGSGDTLNIVLKKPFRNGDSFDFRAPLPKVNRTKAKNELDRIKVVPNPYVAATTHELPLPSAITSGRGERRIDFIHLPAGAVIHIFTSRGEHVITLQHDNSIFDGTVSWNLKSKENLDVAAGIYFYVVESSVGSKTGKIALIK